MIVIILKAIISTAILYTAYELGRCSAVKDLRDGKECEDLEYYKKN